MSKVLVDDSSLIGIGGAIRSKNGSNTTYKPSEMASAINAIDTGGITPTGSIAITENGTVDVTQYASAAVAVPNSYSAGDEGKVVSNGALVVQTPTTITQNGTIDTTLNNEVVVNVSGGGISVLTQEEWDALTTAQKQSYGLIGIVSSQTGYRRGIIINAALYSAGLPYSNQSNIICNAFGSDYDSASRSWGSGSKPVTLTNTGLSLNADNSVRITTKTTGILAYVDLGASATPFTAYIVAKIASSNGSHTRLISAFESRTGGHGIMLYGESAVNVSVWANDSVISPTVNPNQYFVGMIQFGGSGTAKGAAISSEVAPTIITKPPTTAGQYIVIGRTDLGQSTSNAEPTDLDVLFLGVVSEAEDDTTIVANMRYLAQMLL